MLDDILLRVCLMEEYTRSSIPQFWQHSVHFSILLGIGIFLWVDELRLYLHLAVRKIKLLFLQTKPLRPQENPAEQACHESAQTRGDTILSAQLGEEKNEMMASTTSPDISIQKKLEQEKITEGHGGPCLNPLAGTGNQEISIAKPLATGHKSFSIEDILTRKIEQLEQGKNPSLLLYRAINLQDMNTTAALLELEKWNDTEGPEGNLPIHEAAIIGNQQLFDLVFRNTKNKWENGGFLSRTAPDYAAAYGHQEILETLLKSTDFEADGKLPTRALRRAIETAKSNGYQNLANLLNERRLAIERTQKEVEFTNAVVGGDCVTVKGFLEEGVSKPDALEVAFTSGLTEMASILLQSMGKGHSYDLYNATIAAAKSGNFEAVNLLLQKMPGTGDGHGVAREAFVRARKSGNATFFRELLNSTKVSLGFALQVLAEAKDLEVVTWLLDYDTGGSIDGDSLTKALHYAITPSPGWSGTTLSRRIGIVRVLLEHGADVNSPHKIWGSALRHAAASGEPEIVELLTRHGADINATGAFGGSSPMMIAISSGDLSTLRVLIEHGTSFQNLKGIAGNGLQTASFLSFETVVKELLDLGLDINARLEPWGTPLMLALQGNHPSVAKLLLSRGANVKLGIPDCGTALHLAAMIGLEEMTKLLVAAGAEVNAKGGIYCTALQAAVARGHRIIALFLLDHGADLHIQGGVHGNALQAADDMSDGLMIKLLLLSGAKATKPISSSLLS